MPPPGLSLLEKEGCLLVKIEGSARVETAALLKEKLSKSRPANDVAIDWEEAEHVDACVLQILLALRELLAERGSSLVVSRDNFRVREYLKLSGLAEYFPVRERPPQAPPTEDAHA